MLHSDTDGFVYYSVASSPRLAWRYALEQVDTWTEGYLRSRGFRAKRVRLALVDD